MTVHFDYELEFEQDPERFANFADWHYEVFMLNGDAVITISANDNAANVWKFSVPIMNFVGAVVAAAKHLSASHDLLEFKDWDSSFTINFVYADEHVLIESSGDQRFRIPFDDFKSGVREFSDRVKIDLETRYPNLLNNKHFQRFF